jgi:hypothetical protein
MARRKIIYVDGTARRVVDSPFSKNDGEVGDFYTGEKVTVDVVPLREIEVGSGGATQAWEADDSYSADSFKVGIGVTDDVSDSGDYKITYNTSTSSVIYYDEDAAGLETTLNAMADVASAGSVDVTGSLEDGYRLRWRTDGAKLDFGSDEVNLLPESDVIYTVEREGATGIREVVILRLLTKKAALTSSAASIPGGSMSVTERVAGSRKTREITEITCIADTAAVAQREECKAVAANGSDAVAGVYYIDVVADAAGSLDAKHFLLYDGAGSVAFWFDHDGGNASPPASAISAARAVRITTLANGDTRVAVAAAIATAISADGQFTAAVESEGDRVVVTYATAGAHGAATAGDSGFTMTVGTAGANAVAESTYNGTYFYAYVLNSDGTQTQQGLYFSQDGTTDPPAAAIALDCDLAEISYAKAATAQEMAIIIAGALNTITGMTAVASGNEVHWTQDNAGVCSDAAVGDSPLTSFAVTENGSASTLDGAHFLLYETDGEGGEQSRAFWFNVSGNASPSGSALTADLTTEITTVAPGAKAHEVAKAVATALNSLSTFSAVAKGTKARATSSVGYAFTNGTAETSGFTMAVTQVGGTGTDSNEVVEISFSDQAIGGTYSLGINTGNGALQSGAIPFASPPTQIAEILESMSIISKGDVLVEGGNGGNVRLSFQGNLASTAVTVTVDDAAILWIEGFRFTLDLNTTSAHGLLYGLSGLECVFEVEATQGSDYSVKLVNSPCTLRNGLIDPSSTAPTPALSYYTSAQVDSLVIHHNKTISSLTGGTSADLDSLTTTGITPDRAVFFYCADTSSYEVYVLKAGTTTESSPGIIRPDDYATTTNEKYWERVDFNATLSGALLADGSVAGAAMQELLGLNLTDFSIKTLATGAITRTASLHSIAAESGTADTLDTVSGGGEGDLLFLQADAGDTITVSHGTGNISTSSGNNLTLTGSDLLFFLYDGTNWCEVGNAEGSGGGGGGGTSDITADAVAETAQYDVSTGMDLLATSTLTLGDLRMLSHPAATSKEEPNAAQLFELVSQVVASATISSVDTGTDRVTFSAPHGWLTGQGVILRNSGGALPTGVTANQLYWFRTVSTTIGSLHTTLAGAHNNTSTVNLSGSGSGTNIAYEANFPYEVIPNDYDASTNARVWRKRELDPLLSFCIEAVPPGTALVDSTAYHLWTAAYYAVVESVTIATPNLTTGGQAQVGIRVNGSSGLTATYTYVTLSSSATAGTLGGAPYYRSLVARTDFNDSLRLLSPGDTLEAYVNDGGSTSALGEADGLQVTFLLRPLSVEGSVGTLYDIT